MDRKPDNDDHELLLPKQSDDLMVSDNQELAENLDLDVVENHELEIVSCQDMSIQ